jgi:hypothetical protein
LIKLSGEGFFTQTYWSRRVFEGYSATHNAFISFIMPTFNLTKANPPKDADAKPWV